MQLHASIVLAVASVCTLLVSSSEAKTQDGGFSIDRPAYKPLRYLEDWSVLKGHDLSNTGDWFDRLKYVPLSDDGEMWASFGGHMRLRSESWSNFAFGAPANNDDTFLLWRLLMHGDVHLNDSIRAFVEGKSALSTDRDLPGGRRTLDVDSLDLEQAFIDLTIPFGESSTVTLRPGRQQFLFGKQRLVSPLPWANTQRRWDGLSAIVKTGSWHLHGFWSQFVPVQKYDFNDSDAHTHFFGVYANTNLDNGPGLDLYAFGLDQDGSVMFNGTLGSEQRYTVGGRVFDSIGDTNFDYDFEAAYQFGEVGSGDVSAYMIGSQLGYTFGETGGRPRAFIGFDLGSGDDSPGGDVETFNQLYPLGHAYLGYMDFVGRQNIIDVNAGFMCSPLKDTTIGLTGHLFWRDSDMDALYNAGGGVVRPGSAASSKEVGQEIDLTATYRFNRHLTGLAGYSHFFAGDFIDDSGPAEDIDFFYLQFVFTF